MTRTDVISLEVGDQIKHPHTRTKFLIDSIWEITEITQVGVMVFGVTIPSHSFVPFETLRKEYEKV